MNITDYFKSSNWRQGYIIDDTSVVNTLLRNSCDYLRPSSQNPDFLVVLTQNCDILAPPETEPYIDFLIGRFSSHDDGNFLNGKNPRKLQISFAGKAVEFVTHDKFRVTKENFIKASPKTGKISLRNEETKLIIRWISKRFARAAFPDEFNKRLNKADKQLTALSKHQLMDIVSLIFIDISEEELPHDKKYEVIIVIGLKHGSNNDNLEVIEALFRQAFSIPGIEAEINVYDEYDVTYEIISTYKRFDWDYRSLPEDSGVAAPVQEIDTV